MAVNEREDKRFHILVCTAGAVLVTMMVLGALYWWFVRGGQ